MLAYEEGLFQFWSLFLPIVIIPPGKLFEAPKQGLMFVARAMPPLTGAWRGPVRRCSLRPLSRSRPMELSTSPRRAKVSPLRTPSELDPPAASQ